MRGCLTLIIGFVLGLALAAYLWEHPPAGTTAPSASDVRVTISDGYLARRVQQQASALGPVQVQNVSIVSSPPNVLVARGQVTAGPVSEPVTIGLQPSASGGTVQVRIVSTQVGSVPVPGIFTNVVDGVINHAISQFLGSGMYVVGASVTSQGLVIAADYPQG